MLSQTVEYALRAVVFLAQNSDSAQTTQRIADSTKVPAAYLAKVLQGLREKQLVRLQRGIGGGVTLASDISTLTILDVVNAVDPIKRITTCPLELQGHGGRLCALHRRMDDAIMQMEEAFRSTTLAELLDEPNPSVPLCDATEQRNEVVVSLGMPPGSGPETSTND
ncbi:MAG: Rrf2 family transcriptional regulator [Planctomycetaceae bacterium]|nr:Rrf2 family transcriptional regulator [Planctomycetaceae bacterium]